MEYLLNSDELPLGAPVAKMFWRDEYQDEQVARPNLPHVHALVTLEEHDGSDLDVDRVLSNIRGRLSAMMCLDEKQSLIDEGILADDDDFDAVIDLAARIQVHRCSSRCQRRVGPGSDETVCRVFDVRNYPRDQTCHVFAHFDPGHTKSAMKLLSRLGFVEYPANSTEFKALVKEFECTRHMPPCSPREGLVTACNGRLFAALRCNMNVQYCTSYLTSRYVTKYVSKIDENNYVSFKIDSRSPKMASAEREFLHNTKIASSAINENQRRTKSSKGDKPQGRCMSSFQMLQLLLGYEQVHCNIEFVRVPTTLMQERRGLERIRPIDKLRGVRGNRPLDIDDGKLPTIALREDLPGWRQHSDYQKMVLKDLMFSPVNVDKITVFSLRPPELIGIVDECRQYFEWFVRSKRPDPMYYSDHCDLDLGRVGFWDGLGHRVTMRYEAIPKILSHLEGLVARREVLALLRKVLLLSKKHSRQEPMRQDETSAWLALKDVFISQLRSKTSRTPVVVFSNIRPEDPTRFLVHLLTSMGKFETEFELMSQGNIKQSFIKAKLFTESRDVNEQEASLDRLLKRYILEQLIYYPISTKVFDRYCVSAEQILRTALFDQALPVDGLPPVLYTALYSSTEKSALEYKEAMRNKLIDAVYKELDYVTPGGNHMFPTRQELEECRRGSPHRWKGTFAKSDLQSEASYEEQKLALASNVKAIDQYFSAPTNFVMSSCTAGSPGCGKTSLLMQSAAYVLSKGLSGITTALLAERALTLGGLHLHSLLRLPVGNQLTIQRSAELAVIKILRDPSLHNFLCTLDVLMVDEMGQLSAEMLSVMDIIFRRLRDSSIFMGGVLVLATVDSKQLKPIRGIPSLLSTHMLTCFRFTKLKHSVRAANDETYQRIMDLSREDASKLQANKELVDEFREKARRTFTFYKSWDKVPNHAYRVFGKKAPGRAAEREMIAKLASMGHQNYVECKSEDTQLMSSSHGDWTDASDYVKTLIDKNAKEPRRLVLHKFGLYQCTCNLDGQFSQTQLALLIDTPSEQSVKNFEPLNVLLAPNGTKYLDEEVTSVEQMLQKGWKRGTVPELPLAFQMHTLRGGVKTRRRQYALKPRIAGTAHSTMGATLGKLATEVSRTESEFRLWEKAQAIVILSRCREGKDLIFVNKNGPEDTIEALVELLLKKTQYDSFMEHVLGVLCQGRNEPFNPVDADIMLPYSPVAMQLPENNNGYCYMLLSCKDKKTTYIGQTSNLSRRLREHNSGLGGKQTAPVHLRPWTVVAYVTGFGQGNAEGRLGFESRWRRARDVRRDNNRGNLFVLDAVACGADILSSNPSFLVGLDMRMVYCCREVVT